MIPKECKVKDQNNYVEGQKPICDTEDKFLLKLLLYIFFVGNFKANVILCTLARWTDRYLSANNESCPETNALA